MNYFISFGSPPAVDVKGTVSSLAVCKIISYCSMIVNQIFYIVLVRLFFKEADARAWGQTLMLNFEGDVYLVTIFP